MLALYAGSVLSGHAQQAPNLSADQLQQMQLMQQQLGQSGLGSGLGQGGLSSGPETPQETTQQPALPQYRFPLPPSRLEQIMSARAGAKLQQFGYDQLGQGRSVTLPLTGAVQDDYVLGPGDEIVVSLRGQDNNTYRVPVGRDGDVTLPRLPPVSATGRSFGSFRQDMAAAVSRAYTATQAYISLGRIRQISVLVSGEVNNPGQRTLNGLSSAVDAILLSGGVKKTGSLRNVRIQRGTHTYAVDLYGVLTDSGATPGLRLADGDRILVPPLGPTVAVTGLVRRPGIYELPGSRSSITVGSLLALAGGQEVSGRFRLSILRIMPDGQSEMVPQENDSGVMHDSEILFAQLGADQTTSQATLSGGTGLAGQYPIVTGTKLSDILKQPGALGPSPYTLFGIIVRKDPRTLLRTLVAFTPVAVLNGGEDVALQTDDMIRPLQVNEARLLARAVCFYVQGQAAQQQALSDPLARNASNAVGPDTSQSEADRRRIYLECDPDESGVRVVSTTPSTPAGALPGQNPADQTEGQAVTQIVQRPIVNEFGDPLPQISMDALQSGSTSPTNDGSADDASGQQVQDAMQAALGQQANANIALAASGGGLPAGQVAGGMAPYQRSRNETPALNYETQSLRPGQVATNREVTRFGDLARQLGVDPLVLIHFLMDHQVRLDGAVRGPGSYFIGPDVPLSDLVQAAGGAANWMDESGVELLSTAIDTRSGRAVTRRETLPLRQGTLASYIVQPHDELRFNQVYNDAGAGTVTLQGQVRFPGTYSIARGEHLSDLLMRAGGLTNIAYPSGTVFLRKSVAETEQMGYARAADEIQNQLFAGMTRVGSARLDPSSFTAMQGFINQLRNQKALGRISVVADPSVLAAKPALDPLLSGGDVIVIPQRPSSVSVLGQVMQPGSYPYEPGKSVEDYVAEAGGYAQFSDDSRTFIVLPDGSAQKVEGTSWLGYGHTTLAPGSAIVVPRDLSPFDLRQTIIDTTQIFSQLAVSAASLAVLSQQ